MMDALTPFLEIMLKRHRLERLEGKTYDAADVSAEPPPPHTPTT